ncbi:hypothetical protein BsWGS_00609 [Bradybaena similaris]
MRSLCCLIPLMILTFAQEETWMVPCDMNILRCPCTQASQCGLSGCCLRGVCSSTGMTGDRCYEDITENSKSLSGIWNKTETCPCNLAYYCSVKDNSAENRHPLYGRVGMCRKSFRF